MTFVALPTPESPAPAPSRRAGILNSPILKLVAYVFSWFLYSLSFVLFLYGLQALLAAGGSCASGNSPYVIARPCPAASSFLDWTAFTALLALAIAIVLAGGIGFQIRVWALTILFSVIAGVFLYAFFIGDGTPGLPIGLVFLIGALIPLVVELRRSVQRVFLGSINIFGQQFQESPKARPSVSSSRMPNPPDAIKPKASDWAVALLGFAIPAYGGFVLASYWVAHV
jgi:hypothetical protein